MKFLSACAVMLAAFGFTSTASAKDGGGITFIPSLVYTSSDATVAVGAASTETINSTTSFAAKLGYTFSQGLYVGGAFASDSSSTETKTAPSTDTKSSSSASGFGVSVGFIRGGFNFIVTDLLSYSNTDNSNGAKVDSYTGSLINIDLGYCAMFGNWGMGPQVEYTTGNFSSVKDASGNTIANATVKGNSISWGLQFMFLF